jgi:NAD(P)-dependent dehydrogenase (short-subunit alcohol dehydrogenase family)
VTEEDDVPQIPDADGAAAPIPVAGPGLPARGGLLTGKVAVVTGGARGIGLAVARRYVAEGAVVVVADVDGGAAADAAAGLVADLGGTAHGLRVDVTDEDSVAALGDATLELAGRLDVVVANAGVLVQAPALETSLEHWRRSLDVNLTGAFVTCRELGRRLVEQGEGGRVILSSSLFGLRGGRDNAAYSATKFGMIGLAQCLAAEWSTAGVLVNAVCPGQVDTPMLRELFTTRAGLRGTTAEQEEAQMLTRIPIGRLASADEIADAYVFLASDLSRYVTGQAIVVDGGYQVA